VTIHLKHSEEILELTEVDATPKAYRAVFKRIFDILFVLAIAPFVFPVVLMIAMLVATDGSNPFFFQRRIGRNGDIFAMVKLRSMVVGAEEKLVDYLRANPEAAREWEEKQKLTHDPRITWVGRFIRKTSIDELPQFWNVLVGDMSVVGPRPMMPSQREMYPGKAYYLMRPGITGFWQIGDRHATSFADRARYDADYLRAMSFGTDLKVVVKTVNVVARGTGA